MSWRENGSEIRSFSMKLRNNAKRLHIAGKRQSESGAWEAAKKN
jgi:hypothetical protein